MALIYNSNTIFAIGVIFKGRMPIHFGLSNPRRIILLINLELVEKVDASSASPLVGQPTGLQTTSHSHFRKEDVVFRVIPSMVADFGNHANASKSDEQTPRGICLGEGFDIVLKRVRLFRKR